MEHSPQLRRRLTWPLITLYGLGTTIGAGIYVLLGAVVSEAGALAPISFLLASAIVGLSALSFAELCSRMPRSAGEAVYVQEAFRLRWLSVLVGLFVAMVGIVSAAAIANGFVGYLNELVTVPRAPTQIVLVVTLTAVAVWGIAESVSMAAILTLIEIGGLLLIIGGAAFLAPAQPLAMIDFLPSASSADGIAIVSGAFLAFYAFIGFEDMVNVAEEVRDVERVLPRAIVLTLAITTLLYVTLAFIAVALVPRDVLTESDAPLAAIFHATTGISPEIIVVIGMVAVINGALIQIIMAARVLYGLSAQGWLPAALSRINPRTRTPLLATVLAGAIVLGLALWLPLITLAKASSMITLAIFALINLALIRIKRRHSYEAAAFSVPIWIPLAGFASCAALVFYQFSVLLR